MTFEQIRIFVAVAEREHVTRAAEVLSLTQSAASAAIAALEREFGVKLFHRVGRGIVLTEAGRLFLEEARAILGRAELATRMMREVSGLSRGRLSIMASHTIANHFLPLYLVAFRRAYPGITLSVSIGNSSDVAQAISNGRVELGFVEGPEDSAGQRQIAAERIAEDRLLMIVAAGHQWAGRDNLGPAELTAGTWVLREDGSGTRAVFFEAMAAIGVPASALNIAIELPANGSVLTAVIGGAGATILSELACSDAIAAGKVATVQIDLPKRAYFAVQHVDRYRSRAVSTLLAMVREQVARGH